MYNNKHTFYAGPLPIYGCDCPYCKYLSNNNVTKPNYPGWVIESDCEPIYEYKAMANDVLPSGVYRINYSIVDNYGFASTHSVVLKTQAGETPMEALSDFMNASEGYVRYDLIEYFLVRWENREYARV